MSNDEKVKKTPKIAEMFKKSMEKGAHIEKKQKINDVADGFKFAEDNEEDEYEKNLISSLELDFDFIAEKKAEIQTIEATVLFLTNSVNSRKKVLIKKLVQVHNDDWGMSPANIWYLIPTSQEHTLQCLRTKYNLSIIICTKWEWENDIAKFKADVKNISDLTEYLKTTEQPAEKEKEKEK